MSKEDTGNLVKWCRQGDEISVGDVRITVDDIRPDNKRCRITISAPKSMEIAKTEPSDEDDLSRWADDGGQ